MFVVASSGDPSSRLRDLPAIDVAASNSLATAILGTRTWGRKRRAYRTGNLAEDANPHDETGIGVFGELVIVSGDETASWIEQDVPAWGGALLEAGDVDAFVLHSVVTMGGFAFWRNSTPIRAFAGAEGEAIIDQGSRLPFERDLDVAEHGYEWIAENALLDRLGFSYEGPPSTDGFDPATVPLLMYR
ncbi:putative protein OS=Tsukamurella paurometabola (strain ATCC 8368 / DSM / CCUG 35730 /CIP 100753 / JCM 10117 / KCTC 9821 / NBRC 16120 / NCIMB 702349/ NCTC 13040) OX=521096 GN=Tpau_2547 PE=4 SV=1 [Tsukamurella paurometabola]|uniref:Uncharacterized protein n=2 Tax=Tsukamurella paurometabola TaxID=2061 RepID=D5URU5_TSUPD|nr:hypothetical protein Tpau_2547 [Tsukamurella paurometabola DSM 20162]SUP34290.1 Uncharacterised protein [Tsukamurella paurometabola]